MEVHVRKIEWTHIVIIVIILTAVILTNWLAGNSASSVVAMAGVLISWLISPSHRNGNDNGPTKKTDERFP